MLGATVWNGFVGRAREAAAVPALAYPLPGVDRVAVVGARLAAEPGVRSFPHWSTPELEGWRPKALAGRRSELFAIGALRRQGYLTLAELRFPLVVFSSLPDGPLSPAEHERLWSLFELPVYEQIRGEGETLLAWECDARDGWHLACGPNGTPKLLLSAVLAEGWQGAHVRGVCGCGKTCLRLIVRPKVRRRALAGAGRALTDGASATLFAS